MVPVFREEKMNTEWQTEVSFVGYYLLYFQLASMIAFCSTGMYICTKKVFVNSNPITLYLLHLLLSVYDSIYLEFF